MPLQNFLEIHTFKDNFYKLELCKDRKSSKIVLYISYSSSRVKLKSAEILVRGTNLAGHVIFILLQAPSFEGFMGVVNATPKS